MNEILQKATSIPKGINQSIKLLIIGFIIIMLMIPVAWISSLIQERYNRRNSVIKEIAEKWGSSQIVSGPFISVPYKVSIVEETQGVKKTVQETKYLNITPQTLKISGNIQTELHHRGIFKVTGYKGTLDLNSVFATQIPIADVPAATKLEWDKAIISFDISDQHGLKEISGTINGAPLTFENSYTTLHVTSKIKPVTEPIKSRYAPQPNEDEENINFKFQANAPFEMNAEPVKLDIHLVLTGTQQLSFLTSAMQETINLQGDWKSPSFVGDMLPESRTVNEKGFKATWQTNYLTTGIKPLWYDHEGKLQLSNVGVNFLIMVDSYQQATRALKYSILFLLLTFMMFFFAETITKQKIHPVQYLMVGSSLILFYLLLLSISEHLPFGWSYLIAAAGVIMQIGLYCYSILKTRKFALQVGGLLAGLYAFLYLLLRLEDSALLIGSIGLFVLLGIAMYAIRNVNWYATE